MTVRNQLRMQIAQAATRCDDADARDHLDRALDLCDRLGRDELVECVACNRVGLPGQIHATACPHA